MRGVYARPAPSYTHYWMNKAAPDATELPDLRELGEHLLAERPQSGGIREQMLGALHHEWVQCGHERAPLALLVVHVEHLAKFRETDGQSAAASCLKAVVAMIRVFCIRRRDRVFRHGEDEFIAILPKTHKDGARHVATRIANGVINLQLTPPGAASAEPATVSVGGAVVVPSEGDSADELLAKAEHALKAARSRGEIWIVGESGLPAQKGIGKLQGLFKLGKGSAGRRMVD